MRCCNEWPLMHTDLLCSNDCVHPLWSSLLNHRSRPPPPHTHTPHNLCLIQSSELWRDEPTGQADCSQPPVGLLCTLVWLCSLCISFLSFIRFIFCQFRLPRRRIVSAHSELLEAKLTFDSVKKKKKGSGYKGMRGGLVVRCPDGFMSHHPHCSAHCSAAVMYDTSCKGINHHRVTLAKSLAFYRWRQASWLI